MSPCLVILGRKASDFPLETKFVVTTKRRFFVFRSKKLFLKTILVGRAKENKRGAFPSTFWGRSVRMHTVVVEVVAIVVVVVVRVVRPWWGMHA